jgi:hypothetical protein
VRAGEALLVSVSASDPDGDALAFSAAGLPDGAVFEDLGGGAAELSWTPGDAQVGAHSLVIAVADDGMPAEIDSEAFQITVEARPVEPSGDLRLDRVHWYAYPRALFVLGSGARPRETVSIVDAESGALIAVGRANWRGRFGMAVAPFLAPCAVRARVLDAQSAEYPVQNAPRDCGQRVLTRIHELRWKCKRSALHLGAHRAPAGGAIELFDASSGEPLGSIAADHHGEVHGGLKLSAPPSRVRLSARSGEATWDLGAFDVDDCRMRCEPERHGRHKHRGWKWRR